MTIPAPAHEILSLIRVTETGRADATAYDTVFGHNEAKLTKPITEMTVDEVQKWQPGFTKSFGSSATGAYQFMYATLKELIGKVGLSGKEIFNAELQDQLGYELLERRGYQRWIEGKISTDTFMIGLAKEWASFPVPSRMKGAHRTVERGQSYYAGDGLNKALVAPDIVWLACEAARQAEVITPAPQPVPKPEVPVEPEPLPGFDVVTVAIGKPANVSVSVVINGEVIVAGTG
jgi:muramidase (phage lysozyme)